jgi:D-alanyl-D-alanine carboxypeptidase
MCLKAHLFLYYIDMKILALLGLTAFMVFAFNNTSPQVLAEPGEPDEAKLVVSEAVNPAINSVAYGVFDLDTGETLLSHNADEMLPIASITKLFTAASVLDAEPEEIVLIASEDVAEEGRAGKLIAGQVYKIRELLFPLLLESSNDAAHAIGRMVGKIPLGDGTLADASGLSAKNKSSVNKLSAEIRDLYHTQPHIFDITTIKQHIGDETGWANNSPVYDLPGYKGGKHGYTNEANRTLVAVFTEEHLNERELGYIILGSDDVRLDVLELRSLVGSSVSLE